ncbi:DEAD/DEAH box helicase [Atopobacter sp. AH10]|nr:DEAD/DEAH box helicase [Atopobacter sp. AH10]
MGDAPNFQQEEVHLQPTIQQKKRDYFWVNFQSSELEGMEISDMLEAVVAGQNYIEIAPFEFRYLPSYEESLVKRLLKDLDLNLHPSAQGGEFKKFRAPHLKKLLDEGVLKREDLSDSTKFFTDLFENNGISLLQIVDDIEGQLKSYQKIGTRWLIRQNICGIGGILADEMGLGKTVQSIAFLATQYQNVWSRDDVCLILTPASVSDHWLKEIHRFSPQLSPLIYRGSQETRERLLEHLPPRACLIMSYGIFLNDWERLNKLPYASVILDEAQFVKNQHTKTYRALTYFRDAPIYALTGTPVENHLTEFLSLLQLVLPFDLPLEIQNKEADVNAIREWSRPFVLRRVKDEVLELPSVLEEDVLVKLTPKEEQRYLVQLAQAKQLIGSWSALEINRHQFTVLAHITRLRQLCLHHGLIENDWSDPSSKFEALRKLILEDRKNSFLVFSQFASVLPHIADYLKEKGLTSFILDGSTPAEKRQDLVDRFNSGQADVFLISLKAGGTGLSLTRANRVALMDLWWNPAVEGQAFSRAHRIGQERDVKVYRFIAKGTIEEQIRLLQADKDQLFKELLTKDHDMVDDHVFLKAFQEILSLHPIQTE